eukprot:CAMPEP_0113942532 /NCGR_PEP_ID=MMETSP1339-20121228/8234_1 /TAXON_ID=94617 /ORGANISM="Fibrocapsa japonica" /LENGTH=72 /DNA_ID=CAMNT_0000947047 /DNA_START=184 /DNA_END=400 /DNA_ORIENTATION=+ /assembly_acc=CAM_ASM_000762
MNSVLGKRAYENFQGYDKVVVDVEEAELLVMGVEDRFREEEEEEEEEEGDIKEAVKYKSTIREVAAEVPLGA